MEQEQILALNLESIAFNKLKEDFNRILKKTLTNMENQESEEAKLTVELKIYLEDSMAPDPSIVQYEAQRHIKKPTFAHKVSSVLQIKEQLGGELSGNYELVWDGKIGDWVMRPLKVPQMTIFDKEVTNPEIIEQEQLCIGTEDDVYPEPGEEDIMDAEIVDEESDEPDYFNRDDVENEEEYQHENPEEFENE